MPAARVLAPRGSPRSHVPATQAEALEAQGKFRKAAAIYKECVDADAADPGARLTDSPPLVMGWWGLALKRSGDLAGAAAAYDAGLAALERGCALSPEAPEWRESVRLDLLLKKARSCPVPPGPPAPTHAGGIPAPLPAG